MNYRTGDLSVSRKVEYSLTYSTARADKSRRDFTAIDQQSTYPVSLWAGALKGLD